MTKTLAVASGNQGKIRELVELLSDLPFRVCSVQTLLGKLPDVVEDGVTFSENAIKKVEALPVLPDVIYISDDSGLSVEALGGRPGIFSARYGGDDLDGLGKCQLLLHELGDATDRRAYYTCAIGLRFPNGEIQTVERCWHGHITEALRGDQGFGYDPVFVPVGETRTCAEMSPEEKNGQSHRHLAMVETKMTLLRFLGSSS